MSLVDTFAAEFEATMASSKTPAEAEAAVYCLLLGKSTEELAALFKAINEEHERDVQHL